MSLSDSMKYFNRLVTLLFTLISFVATADDIKNVEGEYTLRGDGRLSPAECKRLAADGARVNALAKAFGTTLTQVSDNTDIMHGSQQETHFQSLTKSEVKGEWIGDIGEPQFKTSLDANDNIVVECKIRGRARELTNKAVDFESVVLKNSTDKRNASTLFAHNDDLYLYVSAPLSGYLGAYLADESGEVYCLLPYSSGEVDEIKIKKGYDYIFFDPSRGTDFGTIDALRLTAPDHAEYNKLYVMFSPEIFSPAPVKFRVPGAPPSISADDFNSWLIKTRRNDPRMGVKSFNLLITPKPSSLDRY